MIVMPGAWRCERHRLWTNGDCPDCDADLIASHEERQDEDMSAPLHIGDTTTVTGVVRTVTALHPPGHLRITVDVAPDPTAPLATRGTLAEAIREHMDPDECPEDCDAACLADALLASGALTDATKLAADEALVERIEYLTGILGDQPDVRDYLTALAAALSAQSERAEVER